MSPWGTDENRQTKIHRHCHDTIWTYLEGMAFEAVRRILRLAVHDLDEKHYFCHAFRLTAVRKVNNVNYYCATLATIYVYSSPRSSTFPA